MVDFEGVLPTTFLSKYLQEDPIMTTVKKSQLLILLTLPTSMKFEQLRTTQLK